MRRHKLEAIKYSNPAGRLSTSLQRTSQLTQLHVYGTRSPQNAYKVESRGCALVYGLYGRLAIYE